MKTRITSAIFAVAVTLAWETGAQIYDTNGAVAQTFAGSGFSGYVDGVGQLTMFNSPSKVAADSSGNLFVLDGGNARIRKITPDGIVSTFAGGGAGSLPGYGTNVSLTSYITGTADGAMIFDRSNTLCFTRTVNSPVLLRIRTDGYVTTASLTGINQTSGLCVDSANNLYYSSGMFGGNKIYRWRTNGVVEVFAGSGNIGSADGNGIFTSFNSPTALASDSADNIYVWDSLNSLIRRINQNQDVATIAGKLGVSTSLDGTGTNAHFGGVYAMCADSSGNILVACATDNSGNGGICVRKMNAQTNVTTVAGSFSQSGYVNGAGNLSRFNGAAGVCFSGGTVYVADAGNQRIRIITHNPTVQPVLPADLELGTYLGLRITGTVGRTYRVESSPDTTNWTARATLLLPSSPFLWIDQTPVSGNKFYRALLLP